MNRPAGLMTGWRCAGHVRLDPPAPDWREQLAARLGQRPRRIGPWAELALHGALQCLAAAGEATLPAEAQLRVASLGGPVAAARAIAEQARSALPLPFSFMQSQPSSMLAALGPPLGWRGDARFTLCRDRQMLLELARRESGPGGVLLGWVEEGRSSEWWRLVPAA